MGKFRKFCLLCCVLFCILPGCGAKHTSNPPRLVTQVEIQCSRSGAALQRHYTAPEKMSSVLNYMRRLEGHGPPDTDPERILGDAYKIILHLSDGQQRVYYQRADRYFSRCCGPWEVIDPVQAAALSAMVDTMPSDEAQSPAAFAAGLSECR